MTLDNEQCELCGQPATIHLVNEATGADHLYCSTPDCEHDRAGRCGSETENFRIKRWRLPRDNECSQRFAAPKHSLDHQGFREEMCELQLLGGEGACRYYLSVLTGTDQFAIWDDQFVNNVKEFVVSQTSPAAAQFCTDLHGIQFLARYLRLACERFEHPDNERRITKQERAIELLLRHPDWSDDRIAASVPTTMKQLKRWTDFSNLRAVPKRRNATYQNGERERQDFRPFES